MPLFSHKHYRVATRILQSLSVLTCVCVHSGYAATRSPDERLAHNWDTPKNWSVGTSAHSTYTLKSEKAQVGRGLAIAFNLGPQTGWVELSKEFEAAMDNGVPLTFLIRSTTDHTLELKFKTAKGATYGKRIQTKEAFRDWQRVTVYPGEADYWWGTDDDSMVFNVIQIAVAGLGRGSILLDEIGLGRAGSPSSFDRRSGRSAGLFVAPHDGPILDPDRELPGVGFRQRRDVSLIPEDPLVLEWLKQVQDTSSREQQLLPSMEGNQAQTFNNALAAMAFTLKGERERAERILDYFANATDRENRCPGLQSFFLRGEARGFFQHVDLNDDLPRYAHHANGPVDRWMGDMAWLSLAYAYYAQTYNDDRYDEIRELLKELLIEWYTEDASSQRGYVQHGWRAGDTRLHESGGHPEGNIDCYAVFKLLGDHERAEQIRAWLEANTAGLNQPLDIYTWRVLAYDGERAELLDIPDYDLRFRKTLTNDQGDVGGVYHGPTDVENIWLDGVGHMACAYLAAGNLERGYFYANQMDRFIIERNIDGSVTHAIPFTANTRGDYAWVNTNKGFVSATVWYLFAKNGFNPMTLKQVDLPKRNGVP